MDDVEQRLLFLLYARLKNGRIMLYPFASIRRLSVRPSVNFSFPDNSLRPIELKLGI